MMKEEFLKAAGIEDVNADDYAVIEEVYATHPSIDPVKGKQQIAAIYNLQGGMRIIRDMLPTAREVAKLQNMQFSLAHQMNEIKNRMSEITAQISSFKN